MAKKNTYKGTAKWLMDNRNQAHNPVTGQWVSAMQTGRMVMDVKKDGKPFKRCS